MQRVFLLRLARHAMAGFFPFGRGFCVACGHRVHAFLPYRRGSKDLPPLMHALEVIGSDVDRFECPRCGAHDRERHLILYLEAIDAFTRVAGARVVHFAPERRLAELLKQSLPAHYIACDLIPQGPEVTAVDITRMPFSDESVDLLLANHVLEHVVALNRALSEIQRVLAPGGEAILQTPYSNKLACTWEDSGILDDRARLHAYGQEDHLRLFGRDIVERITASGLEPLVASHQELLPDKNPVRFGVNPAEPLLRFRKPRLRNEFAAQT